MWFNPFDLYFGCMRKLDKKLLEKQIEVFLEWTRRKNLTGLYYANYLGEFARFTSKEDILDIKDDDLDLWIAHLFESRHTQHERLDGKRAVEALVRFYRARGVNGAKKESRGRPMDISGREQVQKYRNMGLKLKEIEKLTGKHFSWIHRVTKGIMR